MKTPHIRKRGRESGMTLIEVLVAVLIFSFGLVGLIGLQARAVQYSTSAEDTSRAALLANDMASAMTLANTISPSASAVSDWQARVSNAASGGLPNGAGSVAASGTVATITITWQPPTAASSAFNSQNQYVTQVVIP